MNLLSFISGLLFAFGLAMGGMTQPSYVIGFLDIFGDWNPTLAFVMGGAVITYAIGFRLITRRKQPLFASSFQIPTRTDLTPKLVSGAALFGVGWGLGGFCPGPAIASIATATPSALVFVGAMLVGMLANGAWGKARPKAPAGPIAGGA